MALSPAELTGRFVILVNGAELVGRRVGSRWYFRSTVEGLAERHDGGRSSAPAVDDFVRELRRVDPDLAAGISTLAVEVETVAEMVEGGAR